MKKAAEKSAKEITQLDVFSGPMAIAFGADEVEAAKLMADFAKTNDALEIVGGIAGTAAYGGLVARNVSEAARDRPPGVRDGVIRAATNRACIAQDEIRFTAGDRSYPV